MQEVDNQRHHSYGLSYAVHRTGNGHEIPASGQDPSSSGESFSATKVWVGDGWRLKHSRDSVFFGIVRGSQKRAFQV